MHPHVWTQIVDPGEMARSVIAAEGFKSAFGHLATHPYNENDPENSFWWLFPTGKGFENWPAYHCGKFVFYRPWNSKTIRAGLHIEKGITRELAKAWGTAKAGHFAVTNRWMWHSLLKSLRDGSLTNALSNIRKRTGVGVEFTISVSVPLDEPILTEKATEYRFCSMSSDELHHSKTRHGEKEIPEIEQVKSLSDLATCLESMITGDGGMLWVDVIAGLDISIGKQGTGPPWKGTEVWNNLLEPFSPWIRREC
jgi:hypothetical protein